MELYSFEFNFVFIQWCSQNEYFPKLCCCNIFLGIVINQLRSTFDYINKYFHAFFSFKSASSYLHVPALNSNNICEGGMSSREYKCKCRFVVQLH